MRHTKIVATVGPASDADDKLDALVAAGVDVFRLNFSHGTHESHAAVFARIRAAAARAGREVAILQDLGGPKIRTGRLASAHPIHLVGGASLRIATGDVPGGDGLISTSFAGLAPSVHPGDRLLLADGRIELRVEATDGSVISTTVVQGGDLGEHAGINAPGVALPASAITAKDADDLAFGIELGVDLVAISFVRSSADLVQARQLLANHDAADVPLVAKLERPEALDDLPGILSTTDAVMVARGDLGLEMPLERVPRAQKEITREARHRGVPVIVATQVLESMTTEARPTRAEVNDAANAVDDGVDAIMLAGETAIGAFPVRAVQTLDAIVRDAEMIPGAGRSDGPGATTGPHAMALCEAAVTLANAGDAHAIVAVTRGGHTARRLSALRPRAPILAATERHETARRLAICRGVTPICTASDPRPDAAVAGLGRELVARGAVPPGSTIVLVSINPDLTRLDTNYVRLLRV